MELGTQKPSRLLRRMRELARGKIPDSTLQIMWNGHLPSAVKAVLAVTEVKEELPIVADKVTEASRPVEVAELESRSTTNTTRDLTFMIQQLSIEVAELHRSRKPQRGRRGRRFRPPSSRTRDSSRNRKHPEWLCFYHYRYGEKATRCVNPCNWRQGRPSTPAENQLRYIQ
ncbi:uncharacterized protein LOC132904152 [Amyelois transitella]|uniref:uncharacterized protein LOC132904152 n=1 Tax=Amyelois transitella TaxID=680683 RepID=UPI0029906A86|nr:uncharacterized protein LOC132904152 [Amyelois transitella]